MLFWNRICWVKQILIFMLTKKMLVFLDKTHPRQVKYKKPLIFSVFWPSLFRWIFRHGKFTIFGKSRYKNKMSNLFIPFMNCFKPNKILICEGWFNVHFGDLKTEIRKKRLWKKVLLIVQSQDIQYAIAPLWYCVYRIRAVTLFSLYATCITSLFCAGCLCRNKDDILQEHLRVHNQSPGNQQQQTHDQCSGAILTRLQLVKIPAPAPALRLLLCCLPNNFCYVKKTCGKFHFLFFQDLLYSQKGTSPMLCSLIEETF